MALGPDDMKSSGLHHLAFFGFALGLDLLQLALLFFVGEIFFLKQ